MHPLVRAQRNAFVLQARQAGARAVVVDIPLLFETGGAEGVDMIVVVSAAASLQQARVLARPGMTAQKFAAILARQIPDAEKRRLAHWVIDTGHGLTWATVQVADVLRAVAAMPG